MIVHVNYYYYYYRCSSRSDIKRCKAREGTWGLRMRFGESEKWNLFLMSIEL